MIFDTPILCLVTNQLRSDNNRTLETIESVTGEYLCVRRKASVNINHGLFYGLLEMRLY